MRVQVDLHNAGDGQSVNGRIRREDGTIVAFDGWLDLLRVLEEALGAVPTRHPNEEERP